MLVRFAGKGGWFFYFPVITYQSIGGPKKIGRKEVILRFFFSLGIWGEKKNRDKKRSLSNPKKYVFFLTLV